MNGKESMGNHWSPAHALYKGPTANNHITTVNGELETYDVP